MITLLLALAALGQAQPTTVAANPPADSDPIVCHRAENSEVGTHMRAKPVCMRKSDWKLIEEQTQRGLQHLSDHNADPGRDGRR